MLKLLSTLLIAVAGLSAMNCRPGRSSLMVGQLPNYNRESKDHIIFLTFQITGEVGGREKVRLMYANAGNGRMKEMLRPVHFPYQIIAIPRYTTNTIEREMAFEHPLFKSAEISDPSGKIRQVEATSKEGTMLVRLQQNPGLNRLELFSVSPQKGAVKIYTLHFD